MKPIGIKLIAGTAIILFFLATSVWADGRGRGGRSEYKGGRDHKHGYYKHSKPHFKKHYYKKHYYKKHHYKKHHFKKHYRHYKSYGHYYKKPHRHHYRAPHRHYYPKHRYHWYPSHKYYRPYYHGYGRHGIGLHFSIYDPYFSFGFSTGIR